MISIVDENVLVVANDLTRRSLGLHPICPEASDDCGLKCADALTELIENGIVGLDEGSEVFDKYKSHCSFSGQPGVGDAFLRAVFERGYIPNWARRINIRLDSDINLPGSFLQCGFDNDDYVWIALAYNAGEPAKILNAVDSDYSIHHSDCASIGVLVEELCG